MPTQHDTNALVQAPESKQQQVYKPIRDAILRDEFPAGTVMVERKLCDIYGVSRSPIRNALQQLTFEGFLSYQPGKGTVVADFSLEDILEVYDLIELCQLYAVRLWAERPDAFALETLGRIIQRNRQAIDSGDPYETSVWDQRFHEFIVAKAGNHRLQGIYEQLHNQQLRFIARSLHDMTLSERSYQEHKAICEQLAAGDAAAAEQAVRRHYASLRQYYVHLLISKDYRA